MLLRLAGVICLVAAAAAILRAVQKEPTAYANTTLHARGPSPPPFLPVPTSKAWDLPRFTVAPVHKCSSATVNDLDYPELIKVESASSFTRRHVRKPVFIQAAHVETPPADERPVVEFAAGAVQLRLPEGWQVHEVPVGREVRVVLTPHPVEDADAMPSDGMWLTFHPASPSERAMLDLPELLAQRLRLTTDNQAAVIATHTLTIGDRSTLRQDFAITDSPNDSPTRWGFHLLIETQGGLCEVQASAPVALHEPRRDAFDSIVASLSFAAPRPRGAAVLPDVAAAEEIVGVWKAQDSRLRLHGDGRIEIVLDRPKRVDKAQAPESSSQPIVGRFSAEQDLLRVTFRDGSLLNFRWRLSGAALLLTDHQGRVSQLQRLLE